MIARVIHVWNTAGIGGLLARYLDRHYDYESVAISRASHDPFDLATEKTLVWNMRARPWVLRCLWKARNYDIIHLHSGIQWLPVYRRAFPEKKIVLHLHGTKIRGKWDEVDLSNADMVLVSTRDLLEGSPDGTRWLPNPVDEDLIFKVLNETVETPMKGHAFHVDRWAFKEALEYANQNDVELVTFNRDYQSLPHSDFLRLVSLYEYYIDVKRGFPGHEKEEGKILEAMSLTGLEALALGCKVIDWKGEVHEGLPDIHRSEKVAQLLHEFYSWGWKE